jgi:two-component system response regulator RegX3
MNTILLIRDTDARDGIGDMLAREHFNPIHVNTGGQCFEAALAGNPQLLLVDLPLGDIGHQVLKRAAHMRTPAIVMSEVADEVEKSRVLDQGADDYMVKPVSPRELVARIRAVLRRTSARRESIIRFGDVELNLDRRALSRNGVPVKVNRAEFNLLLYFLTNAGRALTRGEILEATWGYQSCSTRTVDVHVARLRAKLERDVNAPQHILTIHGVGYRFVA